VRPLLVAALTAVLGASCGGHGKSASTVETKSKPSLVVRLTADSHHPRVGKPWRYEVRVTDASGKPVPADIHLQILFGEIPVGQVGRHHVENGVWRETIGRGRNAPFPARARGQPLVLEAVVTAEGETRKAHWWIRVR
jgi:hypothetical protein